jgi:hypothetical protein
MTLIRMSRPDATKRIQIDTRSFFTGKCLLIEWMGKPSRLRNDVEGCVWPFRWQLSSAGMASNPGPKHARGAGATKGSSSSSYHRGKAGRQRLNRVWP